MWRNSLTSYGFVAYLLHWLMAILLLVIFALGVWMTGLGYYDAWYVRGPDLHRSLGVLFFALLVFRIIWRVTNPQPAFEKSLAKWEKFAATLMQYVLYLLMLLIPISGYLISTAKGKAISVFNLFEVPATLELENKVDLLGQWHEWMAWAIISLAAFHALAALKHHFINKDNSLKKMLWPNGYD